MRWLGVAVRAVGALLGGRLGGGVVELAMGVAVATVAIVPAWLLVQAARRS